MGRAVLVELFDDGLWAMDPQLAIRSITADVDRAAIECIEGITVGGERLSFAIAGFYEVTDGLIGRVKIYREASADL